MTDTDKMVDQFRALPMRIQAELIETLHRKYMQHTDDCNTRKPVVGGGAWRTECDCGFDVLMGERAP